MSSTANTETTPMTGFDIGRTIDHSRRIGPAPSTRAASMISFGRFSMNRLTRMTLKALAPAGNQIAPVGVEQRRADDRQVEHGEEQRDEQDDRRDEQRHEHGAGEDPGVPRAQDAEHVAAGDGDDELDEPRADGDLDGVEEVVADLGVAATP